MASEPGNKDYLTWKQPELVNQRQGISISFLKRNRTRFRNLLAKELAKGRSLLQEAEHEASVHMRDVNNCIKRLNSWEIPQSVTACRSFTDFKFNKA